MDCLEFRRRIGAEPHSRDPELLAHRDGCAACMAAWERAQHLEHGLQEALAVPVPDGMAERVLLAQATGERRRHGRRRHAGLAIAASLLIVVAGGLLTWRHLDARSLPALAVAHVSAEMDAFGPTGAVSAQAVVGDFTARGTTLRGPVPDGTTFVRDCDVGSHAAVHMVTRRDGEPVAVLYFPGQRVAETRDFSRQGWMGREVPTRNGTLMLLADGGSMPLLAAVERDWRAAIDGLDGERISQLAP